MEKNDIVNILARATNKDEFLAEEERQKKGARIFKRKVLGFFKSTSTKTLDEMAQILYDTGIASSIKEGKEITPLLVDKNIDYNSSNYFRFDELKNGEGNTKYRIQLYGGRDV